MNSKIMKQRNSIFAVLYTLLLVLTIYFMGKIIYNQVESMKYWDFYASFDFEEIVETGENGESKIVYGISTPEQLAGMFVQKVYADDYTSVFEGTEYRLTASIDLSGKSWTAKDLSSKITLDGAGFSIKNLSISSTSISSSVGFVATNYGTIKNIVFEDVNINCSILSYGPNYYVGVVSSKNEGTINNCIIQDGRVAATLSGVDAQTGYLGGVSGQNNGTIKNCTNNADIINGETSAGIVGKNLKSGIVEYCYNHGIINSEDYLVSWAGGICGIDLGIIRYCLNFGSVEGQTTDDGVTYVGGICGVSNQIIGCGNMGSIVGGENSKCKESNVGGIAGRSNGTIEGCYNLGSVYANAKKISDTTLEGSEDVYSKEEFPKEWYATVHGVYGNFPNLSCACSTWHPHTHSKRDSYDFSISYCLDDSNSETVYAYAGGIAGLAFNSVSNCYSISSVSGGAIYKEIKYENTAHCSYYSVVDVDDNGYYFPFIFPDETLKRQVNSSNQYATLAYYQDVYVQPIANLALDGSITHCFYLDSALVNISSRGIMNISEDDVNKISVILKTSTEEEEDSYNKTGASVSLAFDKVYAKNMSVEGDWGDNNCGGGVFLDKRNSIIEFYYNNNSTKNTIVTLSYTDYHKTGASKALSLFQSSDILRNLNGNGKTYFGYDPLKNNGYPYLLEIYW